MLSKRDSRDVYRPRFARTLASLIALLAALSLPASGDQSSGSGSFRIEGRVRDQSGAPVPGAEVVVGTGRFSAVRASDNEGRFIFESVPAETARLRVRARGFATVERKWSAHDRDAAHLEVVLAPAPNVGRVTVTATRAETRVEDTAASIVTLLPEDLSTTAALTLDDALRQVPGFSLFRRSGSRTANPTSQGVSLRGVGASGASRALVLADGIPLNDPFGGWVYWGRIPRESVGGIEVVRGGASELYGTDAIGGVINFITRQVDHPALSLEASYGNERTPNVSLASNLRAGRWNALLAAETFHTHGYVLVDEPERGRIDTPAGARHTTVNLSLGRVISNRAQIFLRGSTFVESRANGSPVQRNRTHIRQLTLGGDWQFQPLGSVSVRVYGGPQVFDQDFSAVAAGRNSETRASTQRVPAQQAGIVAQGSHTVGSRQTIVGGLDAREVRGASDELVFVRGRLASAVGAGGRQRTTGLFGEDLIRLSPRWLISAAARWDGWRNFDALSTAHPLASAAPASFTKFPNRTETAFSPRVSLLHKLAENISLTASAYRAFRAPTLNELYRSFRVGDIVTLASDRLRAERLTGGEAGARFAAFHQSLDARGAFFWSEITHPVTNVTLSRAPGLITRQRQNLGRTRARGAEFDVVARLKNTFALSGGYLFTDARVVRFPANPALEGLLIPQVPRHQLTFQARYANPSRLTISVQGRLTGNQFDDDQNRLRLGPAFSLDALVSRALAPHLEVFAAVENLLNQRYTVGRTPVVTLGPPLLARVGFRLRFRPY